MSDNRQRIAIIGSGISGLGCAYLLSPHHDVTLYEKNDSVGGHARTRRIDYNGQPIAVDTGFIVFNPVNYPHLTALFAHLGVPTEKSVMSFGVMSPDDRLEWGAENLNALFGQRANLLRPAFYKFLFDILTFNRRAIAAARNHPDMSMRDLLDLLGVGDWFRRFYILPMGGAIWSCSLNSILDFPALAFVDFFDAHGLLTVTQQPQWHTVRGGSAVYIDLLTASFKDNIRLNCGAVRVTRHNGKVQIISSQGDSAEYDRVIFAAHANETLALLGDASAAEKKILGAFRYQENAIVLHKHSAIMPKRRRCWASWIYHADAHPGAEPIAVTYWMNHLQNIDNRYPLFVTLNPRIEIPEADIFERHRFDHPIYDQGAVAAQKLLPQLQSVGNSWFCGAYHRNGFHEDGLASAVAVAAQMGVIPPWR